MRKKELLDAILKHYTEKYNNGEMDKYIYDACICCFHCMTKKQLQIIYNEEVKQ